MLRSSCGDPDRTSYARAGPARPRAAARPRPLVGPAAARAARDDVARACPQRQAAAGFEAPLLEGACHVAGGVARRRAGGLRAADRGGLPGLEPGRPHQGGGDAERRAPAGAGQLARAGVWAPVRSGSARSCRVPPGSLGAVAAGGAARRHVRRARPRRSSRSPGAPQRADGVPRPRQGRRSGARAHGRVRGRDAGIRAAVPRASRAGGRADRGRGSRLEAAPR